MTKHRQRGFTLIELLVAIVIVGILSSAAMYVYTSYRNQAKLTAAETNIITALNDFGVKYNYSPKTGKLADLVTGGAIKAIPNDPWTDKQKSITGTEETADWHYENDGERLTVYPLSHPEKIFKTASFGISGTIPGDTPPDLSLISGADILKLTPAQIASLTPEQIAMMSAADFAKLTADQKAALTKAQLNERAIADKVRAMTQEQFPGLPADQIKYITAEQMAAIKHPWWLGQLLKSAGGNLLSQAQIEAISPDVLSQNAGLLSAKQIGWLSSDQIQAVKGGDAIVNMLKKVPSLSSQISPQQIQSIKNPWWFGQLVKTAGDSLTRTQIAAVSPAVLSQNAGLLNAEQIGWLSSDQVQAVKGGDALVNMLQKKPDLISQITPDQVASVKNPWWFGQLIKTAGAKLTAAQIKAIPATVYPKIKNQLTPEQRAWRS